MHTTGIASWKSQLIKMTWPSEYLRKRCPLCFGSRNWKNNNSSSDPDAIVCIDACFTQKRRRSQQDDPVNPTGSVFLSQEDIDTMECEVEGLRRTKASMQKRSGQSSKKNCGDEDRFEQGMRIPPSVLKGCNESFTAADERRQKVSLASTQFFSDTGVMALLCRHDRVIHLANMTSAGEKQHYALALIKSLFSHLPDDFHIGLLYDIGCQLEQSCRKWGYLGPFLPRISFAISVFHAFGHQWACQLIYHPRKREGFGLSDGEGCERFWSSIKPLIPSLRVSGYHQRLFVIDSQVRYLDMKSLTGVGQWLLRRWNHCQEKKTSAKKGLRKSGINIQTLQAEWEAQVSVQTKPASRHSAKATENFIMQMMATQKSLETYEARLDELEKGLLRGGADMTNLNIHIQLRMHALAIKKRIRDQRLERSYRQTVSEKKLQIHVEGSVRRREPGIVKLSTSYNNLCLQLVALIHQGKAPQGAIAPILIQRDGLFKLDVDDDIWQDIGLEDDSVGLPPAWLADERVRLGIRSLLELKRCEEEERRLLYERKTLMEWHSEEWRRLEKCRVDAGKRAVVSLNILR
ncbi:hypothetical protein BKA82DRAFT_4325514 [Pisolithus tinctorius]|nr:hypothetical protein BKA82DRAFT_4325514 [Pisolithus tinctorius]